MKPNRIGVLVFSAAVVLLAGCNFNNPPQPSDETPGYYSRELELSSWVDEAETVWMPVENRIYNESGRLTAVSKHFYEQMTEPGYEYYMLTRTDVYEVDKDGNQVFVEYYHYDYHPDYYEYVDDEGNEFVDVDYLLERGETRTPDDILRYYYDALYFVSNPDGNFDTPDYDHYESITDKREADNATTALQLASYIIDPNGERQFRTEQYFVINQEETSLELQKEFASWYGEYSPGDGYYVYLYDLYHSFRGESAADEFYYFTRYSRDENGNVYEQTDYIYDFASAAIPTEAWGTPAKNRFTVTASTLWPLGGFNYNIEFDMIGAQATVLRTEYDERGNITRDERWYRGELTEYTNYIYNGDSELTDKNRYTQGGSLLRDRRTVRFREQEIYGKPHSVKETCEYKYYDYSDTESQSGEEEGSRWAGLLLRPSDSCAGLDELQMKHLQYDRLNNNYRK